MIDVSPYIERLEALKTYISLWVHSHNTTSEDWFPRLPFKMNFSTEPPDIRYFTFNEWYKK